MVAGPTATHCRLLTGSRITSTASAPKTVPLSRKRASRPNGRERQRADGRDCPHHCALRRQNFRPQTHKGQAQHHERQAVNARTVPHSF
jgi:hypothetical protein